MTRLTATARRAEQLLGSQVVATAPVAGGDITTATRLRLSDGRTVIMKSLGNPPPGFFEAEARSLASLAEAGDDGVPVPEVLAVDQSCLLLPWIERGKPSVEAALDFGRRLAHTHTHRPPTAYGAERDGFIGRLPLPNSTAPTWPEFYATRRVLPYLKLARDRGAVDDQQAAQVEAVIGRLADLIPEEPPARLHGDLWNGNLMWAADGRVHAIDPASYAGHRETDLAMLALFGLSDLARVTDAYLEVAPLAEGWEDRIPLHQLFPLLTHAAMFGGGYGARAAAAAAHYA